MTKELTEQVWWALYQRGLIRRRLSEDLIGRTQGTRTLAISRLIRQATSDLKQASRTSKFAHVDVIPAGSNLQPLDLTDQRQWEKADLHLSLVDLVAEVRTFYDLILFDCPTKLSLCGSAALTAADFAPHTRGLKERDAIDCVGRKQIHGKLHESYTRVPTTFTPLPMSKLRS